MGTHTGYSGHALVLTPKQVRCGARSTMGTHYGGVCLRRLVSGRHHWHSCAAQLRALLTVGTGVLCPQFHRTALHGDWQQRFDWQQHCSGALSQWFVYLQRSALLLWPIAVEVCPTSNCTVLQLRSLRSHPTLRYWLRSGATLSE